MIVYTYDKQTGEYLDQLPVQKHPLRDEYLLPPPNTVEAAPPEVGVNQVAKVTADGLGWEVVDDFRGVEYYLPDGTHHKIEDLGETLPAESTSEPPPPLPEDVRRSVLLNLDRAAGTARARFATESAFIESEYRRAYDTAVAYIEAGYTGDVPAPVQSHADAFGETAQQAADSIKATGDQWNQVLDAIRDARLKGKQAVVGADDGADFKAIAQPFLDLLEALNP